MYKYGSVYIGFCMVGNTHYVHGDESGFVYTCRHSYAIHIEIHKYCISTHRLNMHIGTDKFTIHLVAYTHIRTHLIRAYTYTNINTCRVSSSCSRIFGFSNHKFHCIFSEYRAITMSWWERQRFKFSCVLYHDRLLLLLLLSSFLSLHFCVFIFIHPFVIFVLVHYYYYYHRWICYLLVVLILLLLSYYPYYFHTPYHFFLWQEIRKMLASVIVELERINSIVLANLDNEYS